MVNPLPLTTQTLYEQDYYLWLKTTINQLCAGQFIGIDLENLIAELESLGRREKRSHSTTNRNLSSYTDRRFGTNFR